MTVSSTSFYSVAQFWKNQRCCRVSVLKITLCIGDPFCRVHFIKLIWMNWAITCLHDGSETKSTLSLFKKWSSVLTDIGRLTRGVSSVMLGGSARKNLIHLTWLLSFVPNLADLWELIISRNVCGAKAARVKRNWVKLLLSWAGTNCTWQKGF